MAVQCSCKSVLVFLSSILHESSHFIHNLSTSGPLYCGYSDYSKALAMLSLQAKSALVFLQTVQNLSSRYLAIAWTPPRRIVASIAVVQMFY